LITLLLIGLNLFLLQYIIIIPVLGLLNLAVSLTSAVRAALEAHAQPLQMGGATAGQRV
jgi:hypothetical protein